MYSVLWLILAGDLVWTKLKTSLVLCIVVVSGFLPDLLFRNRSDSKKVSSLFQAKLPLLLMYVFFFFLITVETVFLAFYYVW